MPEQHQTQQRSDTGETSHVKEPRKRAGGLVAHLGHYQPLVETALDALRGERIIPRIWAHDHTVWKQDPTEIENRLGWLHSAEAMIDEVPRLNRLAEDVRADGYTDVLLLGMGGSSLAPEVFSKVFGTTAGGLNLAVLDSTDPDAVRAHADRLDPAHTLFIVATKSGGTVETLSFFKFFYNLAAEALGTTQAGKHFVAITDPGSKLVALAEEYRFRSTFLNNPDIGGRYSALSYFGLVPATLVGVDVARLLKRAMAVADHCQPCDGPIPGDNCGERLGAILGTLAKAGRDKLTLVASPPIASFGNWVEQLIAESTGKEGAGIVPVVGEAVGPPAVYAGDRLFVYLRLNHAANEATDRAIQALEDAGHPVIYLHLRDAYDLGGQFFLWEMATAVAGNRLGINPFDQPNVEAAKVLARKMVAEYMETGKLPVEQSAPLAAEAVVDFLSSADAGDPATAAGRSYVALQAYVQPTPETDAALQALRIAIRDRFRLATTVGYGPRFLHSTGQLHKGDAGHGLFIQFTSDAIHDLEIPDEAGSPESTMTFGVLKQAQALGDLRALRKAGRQVIHLHLGTDVVGGLQQLTEGMQDHPSATRS
jgi:glucose-6-phosphate isomerase